MAGEPRLVHPDEEGYADERTIQTEFDQKTAADSDIQIAGMIDEFMNPVILQSPVTTIGGFFLENPAEEKVLVLSGDTIPVEDYYTPWMKLVNPGPEPDVVEPEIELYKWDPENCEILYQTSFEDNAANYMEWAQIDGDCADPGTYYDGWTWSDARACDGDHSFKNTMYDEYKNMQDDYLYMKEGIDITDYSMVTVHFDTFVAGEWEWWYSDTWGDELYTPLDWLEFGIIDSGTMYYYDNGDGQGFVDSAGYWFPGNYYFFDTSLPLFDIESPAGEHKDYTGKAEKIDGCPGWWHVWADVPVGILSTPEEFGIWFGFHSDKERVYEGAYVDNIIIEGCLPDGEKIYQGHSQNWLTIEEGATYFEFPLVWDDVEEGTYKAIIKVKNDEGAYDEWIEFIFDIADKIDCGIADMYVEDDFTGEIIPDGGVMTYTADAHIPFTYHNGGNVALSDVAVKATGYKIVEEELFFDDFEGMSNWVYFYEDYPLYATDTEAFSGSKSLALNNPDINMVVGGDNQVAVRYIGYSQDGFSMEGVEEAWLDFYYKAVLPPGSVMRFMVLGYQYVVGIGGVFPDFSAGWCQKTWIGPMQPQCSYASIPWMALWDIMVNNGYMYDDNGHMTYDTGVGLWLDTTAVAKNELVPYCCFEPGEQPWSGVFVDDISVTALTVGEKAWEDTIIIPGPCEPCETCSDQFTWEDVPYSNYKICIEAICDGDTNDDNNEMCSSIIVLEDLEKASKVDFVDYTDCDDEAWCISNVVGAGDHYALATNCDDHCTPEANAFVALGDADCNPGAIDISHLNIFHTQGDLLVEDFEGGDGGFTVIDGDGNPANWEYGSVIPTICVAGGAMGSWFYIDDDAAGSGAGPSTDNWLVSPDFSAVGYSSLELDFDGDFQDMAGDGELTVYVNDGSTDYAIATYTLDVGGFDGEPALDASIIGGNSGCSVKFHYTDDGGWAWGALIDNVAIASSKGSAGKDVLIDEGFEGGFPPAGWGNTGWLDSLYGSSHSGSHHAYSWTAGDALTTPSLDFLCDSQMSFWYAAEGATHPMDLEVYCNGDLVFSSYGFTHTTYMEANIDLSAYDNGPAVIEFVGLTSDFYGQCLDDILIETFECGEPGDEIPIEFNYQLDLYDPLAVVYLEVAGFITGSMDWAVVVTDDYGDGWDAGCYVDLYVNEDKVVDGLTPTGTYGEQIFTVQEGDVIKAAYYSPAATTTWEEEHAWYIFDHNAAVIFSDGVGGTIPVDQVVGPINVGTCEGCSDDACPFKPIDWEVVATFTGNAPGLEQFYSGDLAAALEDGTDHIGIRFRYESDTYCAPGIGMHIHDIFIGNLFEDGDFYEDFEDGNLINEDSGLIWGIDCEQGDHYWEQYDAHQWIQSFPAGVDNALVWCTEIEDAYEAYFEGMWSYDISADATISVELSADGGQTWFIIALVEGPASSGHGAIPCATPFDLTPWAGQEICIRVRVQGGPGFINVSDFVIAGKQDRMPPTIDIALSGNNIGGNMYAGPVTVKITADDDMGMGEIHYILDGTESVVSGDTATFTVSGDGSHSVEAFGVDATGNEGAHQSTSFSIDASPPTVAITAPEPGLYLFGSKLLSMSKPFIIGAFTIEATADDAQGVYVVQFMLNGEVIGEDTEAPFDTYCAVKNMGGATLKAVAIDGVGNTAEDTLDVTYYKFL